MPKMTEEQWADWAGACYDAKSLVKACLAQMEHNPKGYPEFFQMRRVMDYLQRQATQAEANLGGD